MSQALLIARRELSAYRRSPLGAIVIAGALLIDGIYFYWKGLAEKLVSAQVLSEFFYGASGTTMIAGIVLAMRLLAEERQTGTLTLLNTSPVKDSEIVLGKFVSAFGVLALMTAFTVYMPLLIFVNGKVSVGHIVVGYAGLLLLGAARRATESIDLIRSGNWRGWTPTQLVGVELSGKALGIYFPDDRHRISRQVPDLHAQKFLYRLPDGG